MNVKFNDSAKWGDVGMIYSHCIADTDKERVKAEALKKYGVKDGFYSLTLGQLLTLTEGKENVFNLQNDGSAYEHIFIDELTKFIEGYFKTLESYSIPQTAEEKMASGKCVEVTGVEGLLIFCKNYFNLHNFTSAENITLAEILIAKKDAYNTAIFEREINKIQMRKYHK